jgi:hypothetical protein
MYLAIYSNYCFGANLATTFENSHYDGFVFGASLSDAALAFVGVHEACGTTNESFVNFDFFTRPLIEGATELWGQDNTQRQDYTPSSCEPIL